MEGITSCLIRKTRSLNKDQPQLAVDSITKDHHEDWHKRNKFTQQEFHSVDKKHVQLS